MHEPAIGSWLISHMWQNHFEQSSAMSGHNRAICLSQHIIIISDYTMVTYIPKGWLTEWTTNPDPHTLVTKQTKFLISICWCTSVGVAETPLFLANPSQQAPATAAAGCNPECPQNHMIQQKNSGHQPGQAPQRWKVFQAYAISVPEAGSSPWWRNLSEDCITGVEQSLRLCMTTCS
jgi:hypothetical protein